MTEKNKEFDFTEDLQEVLEEERAIQGDKSDSDDKILFTGLDNSGKTTIIKILQQEYSQISMLKPTRRAQRKIFNYLGKSIAEWDLGGQERYRIAYLKEPTKYFDRTSVCIYVFDMQDKNRFEEAISYFDDVIEIFKEMAIEPHIFIFFHKMDPEFEKENNVYVKGQISDLKLQINKITQGRFNITFIETTIFDLWSIISSFSQILLRLYPQSDLLDRTIEDFSKRIKVEAVIILDENSLVIGQNFESENSKSILASSTPYFLTLADTLGQRDKGESAMVVERADYLFYIDQFSLDAEKGTLFLLMMKDRNIEKTFNNEKVQAFIKILKSIL